MARVAPIRQRLAVELPVVRLAARARAIPRRAEDVPSHAVDGVSLDDFACVTLDQVQIARRVQADEAVDAPVGVAFGVNEVPALMVPHVLPVPVQRHVPEGGDPPLVKLFDRAAEPVPLHAGKLRADLRLVATIAVMRDGHDDRAVEVVLLAELGQCRRIRLAEEKRQAGSRAPDPIPVDIELPITVARPLGAILGHGPVGGKPRILGRRSGQRRSAHKQQNQNRRQRSHPSRPQKSLGFRKRSLLPDIL